MTREKTKRYDYLSYHILIFNCQKQKRLQKCYQKRNYTMPYARIISTEFKSEQDLEVAEIAWKKWYPDNMPASLSRHIVRTGDKSTMMTSVYENEDLLNQAQAIAAQWWEMYGHHVYETIVFDGPTID